MPNVLEERKIEQSRKTFNEGINTHVDKLSHFLNVERKLFRPNLITEAVNILTGHAVISQNMASDSMKNTFIEERRQRGMDVKEGYVICVDGRLANLLLAGKNVNIWEEPASLFNTKKDSDGSTIVESDKLTEVITKTAQDDREMFEMVFAHTSLTTDHVCGKAAALSKQEGRPLFGLTGRDLAKKNIEMLESEQIPAITNTYNKARKDANLDPLKQVAVSALIDTDTYGMILNFGNTEQGKGELSTTALLEKSELKNQMIEKLGGDLQFAKYKDTFDNPNFFKSLYKDIVKVTGALLDGIDGFAPVTEYINTHYSNLTDIQKKAFIFSMARTIAMQYTTGLSYLPAGEHPHHRFAEHDEGFATMTTEGGQALIGRFDASGQSFGVTTSSKEEAQAQVRDVVLPLLDKSHKVDGGRHTIFVSAPCPELENVAKENAIKKIEELMTNLLEVNEVKKRIQKGNLLLVPVLVDEGNGEIMDIPILPMLKPHSHRG